MTRPSGPAEPPGPSAGDEFGTLYVEPRCPTCQRFIRLGPVSVNGLGRVRIEATCRRCGPVVPEHTWEE